MNSFSTNSASNLSTCHNDLQVICKRTLATVDISVVCGERKEAEQHLAVTLGNSKLDYPNSKHNLNPTEGRFKSHAVDLYIWHPKYGSLVGTGEQLCKIADDFGVSLFRAKCWFHMQYASLDATMQIHAQYLGIKLRWGGDWNSEHGILDQTFDDYYHWELIWTR